MNDLELIHRNLSERIETSEVFPFGPQAAVYKVAGKMFAILSPDVVPPRMNLKCDPDRAVMLRDEHEAVVPGYHMNKKHWNTLILDGSLPDPFVIELIDHSFDLVLDALKRVDKDRIRKQLDS